MKDDNSLEEILEALGLGGNKSVEVIDISPPIIRRADRQMAKILAQSAADPSEMPDLSTFEKIEPNRAYLFRPRPESVERGSKTEITCSLVRVENTIYYQQLPGLEVVSPVAPKNGKTFEAEELRDLVAPTTRMLEIVQYPQMTDTHRIILDEEGWLQTRPELNVLASIIAGGSLAGTIVLCPHAMFPD